MSLRIHRSSVTSSIKNMKKKESFTKISRLRKVRNLDVQDKELEPENNKGDWEYQL